MLVIRTFFVSNADWNEIVEEHTRNGGLWLQIPHVQLSYSYHNHFFLVTTNAHNHPFCELYRTTFLTPCQFSFVQVITLSQEVVQNEPLLNSEILHFVSVIEHVVVLNWCNGFLSVCIFSSFFRHFLDEKIHSGKSSVWVCKLVVFVNSQSVRFLWSRVYWLTEMIL